MQKGKKRIQFVVLVLAFLMAGALAYPQALFFWPQAQNYLNQFQVNLGLDLQGGVHLEYEAQTENLEPDQIDDAMNAVVGVIERRVNAFGVSESVVQRVNSGTSQRIIVELPGVKDIEDAKAQIKDAPLLEFKEEGDPEEAYGEIIRSLNEQNYTNAQSALVRALSGEDFAELAKELGQDGSREDGGDLDFVKKGEFVEEFEKVLFDESFANGDVWTELVESPYGWHIIKKEEERGEGDDREVRSRHILFMKRSIEQLPQPYNPTGLTGAHLKSAMVDFTSQGALAEPQVVINFDDEGKDLFADITRRNKDKTIAIYIDNELVTAPVVQSEIANGTAVITGSYTIDEANDLRRRLNEGALPVPLELVSQQSIEASLGKEELDKSIKAGLLGFLAVALFMLYYRGLGVVAIIALTVYSVLLLAMFKLTSVSWWPWPITLTLSGIAGFVLSIGMAVDANVLIFERIKEEIRNGKSPKNAFKEGFRRAWPSIRDGNLSTILTAFILIWLGTGFVKGFAIILTLGVLLSMFTAVVVTQMLLLSLPMRFIEKYLWLVARKKD